MRWILVPVRIVVLIFVLLGATIAGAVASGLMSSRPSPTTEVAPVEDPPAPPAPPASVAESKSGDPSSSDIVEADLAAAAEALWSLLIILGVCTLETVVLSYPILRSRWGGWKLVVAIMWVLFGVKSFQSQIESMYFQVLPFSMSLRVMLMGAVIAAIFAPVAVLILGRRKVDESAALGESETSMDARQWALRLGAAALIYVALYTVFGHYIAWQSDAVREYYGSASDGSGLPGVFTIPTLGPLQAARALLWVGLGLPIIRMMRGPWWEAALATGLIFAVMMNAQLLLPNAYMPFDVRMVHLVETAPSNFIFGFTIGWLFRKRVGRVTSV